MFFNLYLKQGNSFVNFTQSKTYKKARFWRAFNI